MVFFKKQTKTTKELTDEFNRYLKNEKVKLHLKLRSYLDKNDIEQLRILIVFFKNNIQYCYNINFINNFNLNNFIRSSRDNLADDSEVNSYFNVFELNNTNEYLVEVEYERKLLALLDIIAMEPVVFIKKFI